MFENLFPTLVATAHGAPELSVPTRPGGGVCEVVVFTQDPTTSLGALPLSRLDLIARVWADRYRELGERADVDYVFEFENRGVEVGVTLAHPHGQIYGYPFVPPIPARELQQQADHLAAGGRGLLEQIVTSELEDGRRVLYQGDHVAAFIPVFARYSYEVDRDAPGRPVDCGVHRRRTRRLRPRDEDGPDEIRRALVEAVPLHHGLSSGADRRKRHPEAHFHVEFYPAYRMSGRLKYFAGSEMGAGVFTADTLPEEKAKELQAIEVTLYDIRTALRHAAGGPRVGAGSGEPHRGAHRLLRRLRASHRDPAADDGRAGAAQGRLRACVQPRCRQGGSQYIVGSEARRGRWMDYLQGITWVLVQEGFAVGGADIRIESTVPLGSGLSSSAALEIALLRAFREAFMLPLDDVPMALLGQRAENDFVGAPVGVMDQMACTLASDGEALFLDTRSLEWKVVPLPKSGELVVFNSGIAHTHSKGGYRTRRAECEEAARQLGVAQLRDFDIPDTPRAMALRIRSAAGRAMSSPRTRACSTRSARSSRETSRRSERCSTHRMTRCGTTTRSRCGRST